jgi:hypothetical protein
MKKAGWLKKGIATPNGIVTPAGEVLKRRRMTLEQINEWNNTALVDEAPMVEVVADVAPAEPEDVDLDSMTKVELEELGRDHGIELDRREKKASLIDVLKYVVK